jgi:hypothetical protein
MAGANAEPLWKPAQAPQQGQPPQGIYCQDVSLDFVATRPSSRHAPDPSLGSHSEPVVHGEAYQLSNNHGMLRPGCQTALECSLLGLARFGDDMLSCQRGTLGDSGSPQAADGRCAHVEHSKERVEVRGLPVPRHENTHVDGIGHGPCRRGGYLGVATAAAAASGFRPARASIRRRATPRPPSTCSKAREPSRPPQKQLVGR